MNNSEKAFNYVMSLPAPSKFMLIQRTSSRVIWIGFRSTSTTLRITSTINYEMKSKRSTKNYLKCMTPLSKKQMDSTYLWIKSSSDVTKNFKYSNKPRTKYSNWLFGFIAPTLCLICLSFTPIIHFLKIYSSSLIQQGLLNILFHMPKAKKHSKRIR